MPSFESSAPTFDGFDASIELPFKRRRKSRFYAALLGIFLGALGAHRFYLGYKKLGTLQIAVTVLTGGAGGLWGMIEGCRILFGQLGLDAAGHRLGHRAAIHWLAALSGAVAIHVGAVAAIMLSDQAIGHFLPPPKGKNSIRISASIESARPTQAAEIQIAVLPPPGPDAPQRQMRAKTSPIEKQSTQTAVQTVLQVQRAAPTSPFVERHDQENGSGPSGQLNSELVQLAKTERRTTERVEQSRKHRPPPHRSDPNARQPATESSAAASSLSLATREQRGVQTDALPAQVFSPEPDYPPGLLARRIEGLVKLRVRIGADGLVHGASVYRTSGFRAFDQAALDVIDQWRFEPARRGGISVGMEVAVPVRFIIDAQQ